MRVACSRAVPLLLLLACGEGPAGPAKETPTVTPPLAGQWNVQQWYEGAYPRDTTYRNMLGECFDTTYGTLDVAADAWSLYFTKYSHCYHNAPSAPPPPRLKVTMFIGAGSVEAAAPVRFVSTPQLLDVTRWQADTLWLRVSSVRPTPFAARLVRPH